MTTRNRLLAMLGSITLAILVGRQSLLAQPAVDRTAPAKGAEARPTDGLAMEEQHIADKYKHLEDVLLRMAELGAASDPRRAALLKKVVAQSKDQLITVRLDRLVEMLNRDQLSNAVENQTEVGHDLRALLELLMSENRTKHIESEKARLRELLKRLSGIIRQQQDIQGRTTGGDDQKRLAGEQSKVADKTAELANDVRKNEEQKSEAGGVKKESDKQKPEGGRQGEKKGGQDGGGPSSPPATEQQQPQPDKPQVSPQNRIEAARQRMKEAESKLREAKRQGAAEKQEEAIRELQLAKAKLEEILRQLREEEIGRMLTMLEERFRRMLQMQEEVYEGTVRLDNVPSAQRTHNHEVEASRLSNKESQIVVEIDKALLLLRDDGTAVAFLEAAQQMRDDMQQVVERLAQAKVGQMTQDVEADILAALKDMIEALKKAQKDKQDTKTPPGQPPPGQAQEPPLVDVLSELKMVRALQMRVNTRTARFSKMIDGEQADNAELVEAIRRLADREQRIHRVTRDLQMGKNQ